MSVADTMLAQNGASGNTEQGGHPNLIERSSFDGAQDERSRAPAVLVTHDAVRETQDGPLLLR